jgi:exodeoxyribonuclease VII small subunit
MKSRKEASPSFEKALERLEAIVEKLESEELGLDASLALFEEGIGLSRLCQTKLEEVEKRVEIILKDSGVEYRAVPYGEGLTAEAGARVEETEEDEEDDDGSGQGGGE